MATIGRGNQDLAAEVGDGGFVEVVVGAVVGFFDDNGEIRLRLEAVE